MSYAKYQSLPVDDVHLDKTNPRIQRLVAMYKDEPSDDQIGMALGAGAEVGVSGGTSYNSLRASIQTNGGLIQPILVNKTADGLRGANRYFW